MKILDKQFLETLGWMAWWFFLTITFLAGGSSLIWRLQRKKMFSEGKYTPGAINFLSNFYKIILAELIYLSLYLLIDMNKLYVIIGFPIVWYIALKIVSGNRYYYEKGCFKNIPRINFCRAPSIKVL